MSGPELSVVCKKCGAEVSPYVTECPYCGTRVRKRAPKLERHGDELAAKETRRGKRARRRRESASTRASWSLSDSRPWVTIVAIVVPALALVVARAADLSPYDLGAVAGPVGSEWWRFLAAPWVYGDVGYLFVVAVALALLVPSLERRLGIPATAILLVAAGSLGMLAAAAFESLLDEGGIVAAGGNGVALAALCAWYVIRRDEAGPGAENAFDWIAVTVGAAVLVLLPVAEDWANFAAGLAGGIVGTLAALAVTTLRRG